MARGPRSRCVPMSSHQVCPDGLDHLTSGGQHPEKPESPSLNHYPVVHQDLELAVAPRHHVHTLTEFPPDSRRHTDGVKGGDSVGAVTDRNAARHLYLLLAIIHRHLSPTPETYPPPDDS
jgi:hypothetical protein